VPTTQRKKNQATNGRNRQGQFVSSPGPGRKKGVPNKATAEVRAACAAIVDDPAYLRQLHARAKAGTLAPAVECMLWHYAKGKPKEQVEHSGRFELVWAEDE
jgi:hypothetical protein